MQPSTRAWETFGEAALSAAWAAGKVMTYPQAVELALLVCQNEEQTSNLSPLTPPFAIASRGKPGADLQRNVSNLAASRARVVGGSQR